MTDEQPQPAPHPGAHPEEHRNRLADETSPYLLQHAANPVDWYPWGEEALARARAEDRPILLSVGYSSCHWCHVMAHESFEDETIAALMNEAYVNIKVDREERPDVDSVYMTATQAMTGQGGWPMTVFLTPDGQPFYAGTYFPPDDRYGRPGFRRVLEALRDSWENDRAHLLESAASITERLQEAVAREAAHGGEATPEAVRAAVERMRGNFDAQWGGFGTAPKFPSPGNLEFLLLHSVSAGASANAAGEAARDAGAEAEAAEGAAADGDPSARAMALATLRAMAGGGIYDHLGGGFARYSVDRQWLVPHFEKMLYDNAQLVRTYVHAYQNRRRSAVRARRARDPRLPRARAARRRGRSLQRAGRRQRGHRGQVLCLGARRARRGARRGGRPPRRRGLRRHRRGQLRGPAPPRVRPAQRAQPLPHAR